MVPEAPLVRTEEGGLVPGGNRWFVLNAQEARWRDRPGRGRSLPFEGPTDFPQTAVVLYVLAAAGLVLLATRRAFAAPAPPRAEVLE